MAFARHLTALVVLGLAIGIAYNKQSSTMRLQALKLKNAQAAFPSQTALVVGGTSGVGEGIAIRLAQAKFNEVIAGRNADRGGSIVQTMKSINPEGSYRFLSVDAQYIANIKGLAAEFPQLDKLVLTQGIGTMQGYTPTSEGIDQKLALHYYGRMAFIQEFLPTLRRSTQSPRVLSVLSGGVHSPYTAFKEDPELKTQFSLKNAADAAGYYNDLLLDVFSDDPENSDISFGHAAPGFVATNWGSDMPWYIRSILKPLKYFAKSKADCAEFKTDFLLDDHVVPGKLYLIDQYGEPAKKTNAHTEDAKEFISQHAQTRLASIKD